MNHKSSALALTAASSLLVVPLQAQAVAEFSASVYFNLSVSNTSVEGGTLAFSETGASVFGLAETFSGDATVGPTTQSASSDLENGSISFEIGVQGTAGANGLSGSASQSLQAGATLGVVCQIELGSCTFDVSIESGTAENFSVTMPAFESATANADFTLNSYAGQLTLADICDSGSVETGFQGCTFGNEDFVFISVSGLANGSAEARYPAEVSEPTALALFGIGTLGLAALRRRRPQAG